MRDTELKEPKDFGDYGEFLEDSVMHILKYAPVAIGISGLLEDGRTIGSYYQAGVHDKLLMAGSILEDVILDVIRANAHEIKEVLENPETEDEEEEEFEDSD